MSEINKINEYKWPTGLNNEPEFKFIFNDEPEFKFTLLSKPKKKDKNSSKSDDVILSKEQQAVINYIENKRKRVTILTGKAGSGKSTVIKELLKRHVKDKWIITSTTGRSAVNVDGITVDKLFLYDREKGECTNRQRTNVIMSSIGDVIIIDEASMVGRKMFDCIYNICNFNNKDLILVGDWAQALPVKDDLIIYSDFFKNNKFDIIKLQECHRQSENSFLTSLDKIRHGIVDEEVNNLMLTRIDRQAPIDGDKTILFFKNKSADDFNEKMIHKISEETKNEIFIIKSHVWIHDHNLVKDDVSCIKKSGFAHGLKVCLGCKILITQNGPNLSYVNGDTGILLEANNDYLTIYLDRLKCVITVEAQTFHVREMENTKNIDKNIDDKFKIIATVTGFPIKLGYAITIHKSQGLTIPKVYFDVNDLGYYKTHGLCYVALSRVRSINDLTLSGWDSSIVYCDDRLRQFL